MTDTPTLLALVGFWGSLAAVGLTYVAYPLAMRWAARNKTLPLAPVLDARQWPPVSVLLAVYNDAEGVERKIHNLFDTDYPLDRLEVWVGSDGSTDATNATLEALKAQYPALHVRLYPDRAGKPQVINRLAAAAQRPILVLTDARGYFDRQTLPELVRGLTAPGVGLVSGQLVNGEPGTQGIARAEKAYFSFETQLKYHEGLAWGFIIGAYGACYALKRNLYQPPPAHFIADDFYISVHAVGTGQRGYLNPAARCYLNVSTDPRREFRRKARIATGNFQNLLGMPRWRHRRAPQLWVAYVLHKVLRWLTPALLLLALAMGVVLWPQGWVYQAAVVGGLALLLLLPLDLALQRTQLYLKPVRYAGHFVAMNAALLWGLLRYLKGVKTAAWEPTKR